MFRMHEIPTSQMMKICGGVFATGGGSYTAGAGCPGQYSFTYGSDTVDGGSTHFDDQHCTDGCPAGITVVDPMGDYYDANGNFNYYNPR